MSLLWVFKPLLSEIFNILQRYSTCNCKCLIRNRQFVGQSQIRHLCYLTPFPFNYGSQILAREELINDNTIFFFFLVQFNLMKTKALLASYTFQHEQDFLLLRLVNLFKQSLMCIIKKLLHQISISLINNQSTCELLFCFL